MTLPVLFGFIYLNLTLWQVITYEDDFIKVEINIALNFEMRNKTKFKNTLASYTKSIY